MICRRNIFAYSMKYLLLQCHCCQRREAARHAAARAKMRRSAAPPLCFHRHISPPSRAHGAERDLSRLQLSWRRTSAAVLRKSRCMMPRDVRTLKCAAVPQCEILFLYMPRGKSRDACSQQMMRGAWTRTIDADIAVTVTTLTAISATAQHVGQSADC